MRKLAAAVFAIALGAGWIVATIPEAKADGGQIAAGVASGLLGGALIGSALVGPRVYAAPPPPPAYYAPARVYVDDVFGMQADPRTILGWLRLPRTSRSGLRLKAALDPGDCQRRNTKLRVRVAAR